MAKVNYSKRAVEDLANIWDFTHDEWSERQADKYYMILIQACQEIAADTRVKLSVDVFQFGIVFINKNFKEKQHFIIKY